MDGIIPLWKPVGLTSHDCVILMRRLFEMKKVGHTGTLDPAVAGVLPICIGEATKTVPYLTDTRKTYVAEVTLGYATDTEDQTGVVVEENRPVAEISESEIKEVIQQFTGLITQVVPLYSAVRVDGKRLYEYARANQQVERPKRQITIDSIDFIEGSIKHEEGLTRFSYQAICSKGTYIRTLSVDIGKTLGYPAHMSHLIRTATGSFASDETFTIEQLEEKKQQGRLDEVLQPLSRGLSHLPVWTVDSQTAEKVKYGQKLPMPTQLEAEVAYRVETEDQQLLAIYQQHPTKPESIKALRVFHY